MMRTSRGAVKIFQPPIIVSVCLETQRRIAWSRARTANPGPAGDQPERSAGTSAAHPSPGESPDPT